MTSVKISYGYPVYITCGDITHEITFFGGSVEEALKDAGFTPDKYDFVEPSLNTVITETTYIDYSTNYCDIESAIDNTKTKLLPTKVIRDGQMFIMRDGTIYTVLGDKL